MTRSAFVYLSLLPCCFLQRVARLLMVKRLLARQKEDLSVDEANAGGATLIPAYREGRSQNRKSTKISKSTS
jgi:hypothetical protein